MGAWSKDSKSHVSTMSDGDFRSTEKSVTLAADDTLRIEFVGADGAPTVLKESVPVLAGEIVDARGHAARARSTRSWPSRSPRPRSRASSSPCT